MICIIALVVFGILGIFSARYRALAREALDCVFRRLTFRKCVSGLDSRLKSTVTGSLMRRSPRLAGFAYKHFEAISWVFLILMVWSTIYSGMAVYNYLQYGNCNGKANGEGFCIFDPAGNSKFSTFATNYSGPVVMPGPGSSPAIGPEDAPVLMIEFGCYRCQYTRRAEPTVKEILQQYNGSIRYVYRDFPLEAKHAAANTHSEAARCAADQGRFWEYHARLFEQQNMTDHNATLRAIASELGMDTTQFSQCLDNQQHLPEVIEDFEAGVMAGVYGTPTFFINNQTIVGPKPLGEFQNLINDELKKKNASASGVAGQGNFPQGEPEQAGGSCAA